MDIEMFNTEACIKYPAMVCVHTDPLLNYHKMFEEFFMFSSVYYKCSSMTSNWKYLRSPNSRMDADNYQTFSPVAKSSTFQHFFDQQNKVGAARSWCISSHVQVSHWTQLKIWINRHNALVFTHGKVKA